MIVFIIYIFPFKTCWVYWVFKLSKFELNILINLNNFFFLEKGKPDWHKSNNVFEEKEKTDETNKNILEDWLN
jgi:hypothetical protein